MPWKAITTHVKRTLDPVASDMPLYAIVKDGAFYLLDVEDTTCPTLTPDGRDEIQNPDRLPMDALPHIDIKAARS